PRGLVRGQLGRLRGRSQAPPRQGRRPAAPDQVPAADPVARSGVAPGRNHPALSGGAGCEYNSGPDPARLRFAAARSGARQSDTGAAMTSTASASVAPQRGNPVIPQAAGSMPASTQAQMDAAVAAVKARAAAWVALP